MNSRTFRKIMFVFIGFALMSIDAAYLRADQDATASDFQQKQNAVLNARKMGRQKTDPAPAPSASSAQKPSAGGIVQSTTTLQEVYESTVIIHGKWGTGPGEFGLVPDAYVDDGGDQYPNEMAIDDADNIYINDFYNNRIQKFDSTGKYLEMFPIDAFMTPSDAEYDESLKTWNTGLGVGYEKISAVGLAWIEGQLYIIQKRMLDNTVKKYSEKVLVLKAGKFVEATEKEYGIYEKATRDWIREKKDRFQKDAKGLLKEGIFTTEAYKDDANMHDFNDNQGNRYTRDIDGVYKYNKNGNKVFEFKTIKERNCGKYGPFTDVSTVRFSRNKDCFYEMDLFSSDINDWSSVFLQDGGGGMQVIKWYKRSM